MPFNPPEGNYYHLKSADLPESDEYRIISISDDQGIKAIYNVSKKQISSYLFDKDKWSESAAKKKFDDFKNEGISIKEAKIFTKEDFKEMRLLIENWKYPK